MTRIEWTEESWNPIVGCSVVSPGCTNCYAMRAAARLGENPKTPHYAGLTQPSKAGPVWNGFHGVAPESVWTKPLRRRKPTTYFVNSMGDLFHEGVPDALIDRAFAVMALCPQHTFQVLTKRPERMREYFASPGDRLDCWMRATSDAMLLAAMPIDASEARVRRTVEAQNLPNVWLGVSAEDQARADERIPFLLATPAAVRFVSCEPLLGPISLNCIGRLSAIGVFSNRGFVDALTGETEHKELRGKPHAAPKLPRLDWVIAGGESGPGARPMHPDWARILRDQCRWAGGVPFFFKQWGAWAPHQPKPGGDLGGDVRADLVRIVHPGGEDLVTVSEITGGRSTLPGSRYMARVGKARAGRRLDGREWNEMPEAAKPRPEAGL